MSLENLFQPLIIGLILVISLLIGYFKLCYGNKTVAILDKKDKLIMLFLLLGYSVISFFNLGQMHSYGNWNGDSMGKGVEVSFAKPQQLSSIYYYMGFGEGNMEVKYTTTDGRTDIINLGNDYAHGSYAMYKWLSVPITTPQLISKLDFTVNTPSSIELKQLAIFDKDYHYITDFSLSSIGGGDSAQINSLFNGGEPKHKDTMVTGMFLDEVFYARSAYQYIHGISPYAWAHPQLAILIIALGVIIFGMTPFGWRFFPNLSGILLIGVVYLLAKRMFKDRRAAIIASLLIMLDFMHFSFTRTASLDSIKTLFVALEYYYLYDYLLKRRDEVSTRSAFGSLFWCGIYFGLAISCKWDALFAILSIIPVIIYAELVIHRPNTAKLAKIIGVVAVLFVIIPLCIYCVTYIPFFLTTGAADFIGFILKLQHDMFQFHTQGKIGVTHIFNSPWWSWPLLLNPYTTWSANVLGTRMSSSILIMGNPAIWWPATIAMLITLYNGIVRKHLVPLFLVLAIASLWLPWALMGSYTFNYYFYMVTPFFILSLTYTLQLALKYKTKFIVYIYLALVVWLFISFYPGFSGLEFDRLYVTSHSWLSTWRF